MENIVAEIIRIIKNAPDNISCEECLKHYFEITMCSFVSKALEMIDNELYKKYTADGWHVERIDERTLQTVFGSVILKRRLMKKLNEPSIYPLDKELGLPKYVRNSPYLDYTIAKIAAHSTYRVTAMAVNLLSPITISHQQVCNIVRKVGNAYKEWELYEQNNTPKVDDELRAPSILYIEGDGLVIKGQYRNRKEVHRFQIAEGVQQNGNRRTLVDAHFVAEFDYAKAKESITNYLFNNYDLTNTIVISNSDGGSGYEAAIFDEIIGAAKRHEHFVDKFHVSRKCRQRLGWAGKKFIGDILRAIKDYDWENVEKVISRASNKAQTAKQAEYVELLREYLLRNWPYMADMEKRELGDYQKIVGTCESNHRIYSYRMKRQGRKWSYDGGLAMIKIITGLKNNDLHKALLAREEYLTHKAGKKFQGAVRDALKQVKHQVHEGAVKGKIFVDAPTSSAVGQLAHSFSSITSMTLW